VIGDDVGVDDRLQGRPSRIPASISSGVARRSLEAQNCSSWAVADARSSTCRLSISRSSCSIECPLRFARAFSARTVFAGTFRMVRVGMTALSSGTMKKRLFLAILLLVSVPLLAQYKMPPKEIADVVDAPPPPFTTLSPDARWVLVQNVPPLLTIEDLSRP